MKANNNTNRRNAIQQMAAFTMGISLTGTAFTSTAAPKAPDGIKKGLLKPFYLPPPADALHPGPCGINIRTHVRASQTNNQFSCVEAAVAPKKMGPAPHIHKDLDEICYVLEGTAAILVADEVVMIEAGGFHLRPHGIIHTFFNPSDKPLRFMDLYFNQNFEDYLEEIFFKIVPNMVTGNLLPTDPGIVKRMAANDKAFGVTMFPQKRQAIIDKYGLIA